MLQTLLLLQTRLHCTCLTVGAQCLFYIKGFKIVLFSGFTFSLSLCLDAAMPVILTLVCGSWVRQDTFQQEQKRTVFPTEEHR